MGVTVSVNMLTVVHKGSTGVSTAFPDVCKTPSPAGPIPIPYPNVAQSTDTAKGSKTVKADGNPVMLKSSEFSMSTGDEAGSAQGVASNKIKGKAKPLLFSFDVKFDGENVFRMTDLMLQNSGSPPNTPPTAEVQPPAPVIDVDVPETEQEPSLDSVEWEGTEAMCGDEVGFEVRVSNFPSGSTITVGARRTDGSCPLLAAWRGEVRGDTIRGRWVTRTGRNPINPTEVALTAFGLGLSASSEADLSITVAENCEQAGVKRARSVAQLVNVPQADGSNLFHAHATRTWGWDYYHNLEVVDGVFVVTGRVKLVPQGGLRLSNKVKRRWKREIEGFWNVGWREHRAACERGMDCRCPGGCCLFPVRVVCELMDSGDYPEVKVYRGSPSDNGDKWWNSGEWFMERDGREGNGRGVRSHEFGHAMGLYDEYVGGALQFPTDDTGAMSGQPPYQDVEGLMGPRGTDINDNYLDEFHEWFVEEMPDPYERERPE